MADDDFHAPTPGLAHAFDMIVEYAPPLDVGLIATGGKLSQHPVKGGSFEGSGLCGRLVGGAETLLERADGVTSIEASYYIAFANGAVVHAFGKGYRTVDRAFRGMRLTLLFEAAEEDAVAELATRAFVAERREGGTITQIHRIT